MAIINNNAVSDENRLRLFSPLFYIPRYNSSEALSFAYLYFGEEGKDPTLEENRKKVYVLQEDGSTISISQPIRTSAGGVPEYNGSYASLAIDGAYSLAVLDSNMQQEYYFASVTNPSFSSAGIFSIKEQMIIATSSQSVFTFSDVDVTQSLIDLSSSEMAVPTSIDSRGLIRDVDYVITDGGEGVITLASSVFPTGLPADAILIARQNVSTSQEDAVNSAEVYSQPDVATAITVNFSIGDSVKILSDSASNDGLTNDYEVVAGGTGANDGINFIELNNGNQFRLISTRNKFQAYTEATGTATILSGVLSIDVNQGPIQEVTLTENVSSIAFGNVSSSGSTSLQVRLKQDGTGGRSVNFSGFVSAGGVAPALSTGADEEDILIFQTVDASTWHVFVSANNSKVIT